MSGLLDCSKSGFNPCIKCGSYPEIISGFSRKSDDVMCSNPACGARIDVDYTVKGCRARWNAVNPVKQ